MVIGMEQMPQLVLPSRHIDNYQPSPAQSQVLTAIDAGNSLAVFGAAGTGKSRTALQALADFQGAGKAVFLTPTRARADQLLDGATAISAQGVRPVRTPASLAFSLLSADGGPTLLTGSDEQALVAELVASTAWPKIVPAESVVLDAFHTEVRNFLARAGEFNISATQIRKWRANPLWPTLAELLERYEARLGELGLVDSARAQQRAAQLVAAEGSPYELVIADDCQDFTHASGALLSALAKRGATIALFANPDSAVESYRGGDYRLPHLLSEKLELRKYQLTEQFFREAPVNGVGGKFIESIGTAGTLGRASERSAYTGKLHSGIDLAVTSSPGQEALQVANLLRTEHLLNGVNWQHMAVICRSEALAQSWRSYLAGRNIPLAATSRPLALGLDPVTANLTRIVLLGLRLSAHPAEEPEALLAEQAEICLSVLRSPLLDMDSLAWVALSRHLGEEPEKGLVCLIADPLKAASFATALENTGAHQHCQPLVRLARAVAAVKGQQNINTMLWAAWQGMDVADKWARAALSDSKYDDYLDGALALFRFADVWSQRNLDSEPEDFIQEVLTQTLPTDHLAVAGQRPHGVQVLTPASAAGKHFEVVALVQVSQDVWPDMRVRDSFLGATLLADLAKGRASLTAQGAVVADPDPFTSVRHDEARMFACALTRASRYVLVTSSQDSDNQPSAFFTTLETAGATTRPSSDQDAPYALDMRGYVGRVRAKAAAGDKDSVAILAYLMGQHIQIANPQNWSGGPISTDTPLVLPGQLVTVSPSALEAALDCPLKWFFTQHGGNPPATGMQQIGTLIHALAKQYPKADMHTLEEALKERLHELQIPNTFWGRQEEERALNMVRNLARWYVGGRKVLASEATFNLVVDQVRLKGSIDRVELTEDGNIAIVDFKTGRNAKTANQVKENPQLAAYQVAYQGQEGANIESAELVYLGVKPNNFKALAQEGIGSQNEGFAHELVREGAKGMRGPTFLAHTQSTCRTCPVRSSCPALAEGATLI